MNRKEEILRDLRNLARDRAIVNIMREDIASITEDEKQKELPAETREALKKERLRLQACVVTTGNRIRRTERLLSLLPEEEQLVLECMLVNPRPDAVSSLIENLRCERSSIYRIRAHAIRNLAYLRYGAGE